MESCAACDEADGSLKACTACKLVKYCGVDCQVAHRPKHKKACRIRAAEIFDKKLLQQPPAREDCPICMLMLPLNNKESTHMACCGKIICDGCRWLLPREYCPFCNTALPDNSRESNRRILVRIEKYNDMEAMHQLGCYYFRGTNGFPVDFGKAVELFQCASKLGSNKAHYSLGVAYEFGKGVMMDKKKSTYHYKLAAMMGNVDARHDLGHDELETGKIDRAMQHFMISAKCGYDDSLEMVKTGFIKRIVTKEEFEKTLREHQASKDEMKSDQRDRAKELQR
eukprot:scaffold25913_cov23-Cyclotella_meneghiniana.AAC.5